MILKSLWPVTQPRLVRALCCWNRANARSVWSLCAHLPRYLSVANQPIRAELAPTTPRLLLGRKQWIGGRRWELPRLDVSIMDGMGEHYGYPRHHAYVILWWHRLGYVWGLEYSTNV